MILRQRRLTRTDRRALYALLLACTLLFGAMLAHIFAIGGLDYGQHIVYAEQLADHGVFSNSHPLYQFLLIIAARLGLSYAAAGFIVTTLTYLAGGLVVYRATRAAIDAVDNRASWAAALIALALLIVAPVTLPTWGERNLNNGYIQINLHHSPTMILLKPLALLLASRDRDRLLTLTPVVLLLVGAFVAYTVFLPYKAQAGSFKKAYLSLLPLLLPLAGYALERAIPNDRLRFGAMGLGVALLALNAFQMVRIDATTASSYLASIKQMADVAVTLPDTNSDGKIILMTQDPYILRYAGLQSVMYPSEDRNTILEVAARYGVDYLLMPPNRPALDPLYQGTESDPRFTPVANVPGTNYIFFTAGTPETSGSQKPNPFKGLKRVQRHGFFNPFSGLGFLAAGHFGVWWRRAESDSG
jgi:hypothetical protein